MPEIFEVKCDEIIKKIQRIEREQESEYETSFIDNDDGKWTIFINGPSGSKVTTPSAEFLHDDDIPSPPGTHYIAAFKRSITTDKKVFLRMVLGSEIRVGDGAYSKDLLKIRPKQTWRCT